MQGSVTPQDDITPGFMLVQGNRMEALRALLTQWLWKRMDEDRKQTILAEAEAFLNGLS